MEYVPIAALIVGLITLYVAIVRLRRNNRHAQRTFELEHIESLERRLKECETERFRLTRANLDLMERLFGHDRGGDPPT